MFSQNDCHCCLLIHRLVKEVAYYHKEVKENESKLDEMKANDRDPYDIKKFEEVLGESYMMIPDSTTRLKQSLQELAEFLESSEATEISDNEWYGTAKELLEKELVDDSNDIVTETKVDDIAEGENF